MKKTTLLVAGVLASGLATAGQEQEAGAYDPADPEMSQPSMTSESKDLSAMTAADLEGKSVTTATGEEIGEIDAIWESTGDGERIATVEVGGFLGIGEKTIAIPLSDLQQSATGDGYQTSMTRSSIEAHPEFDESGYTRAGETMEDELDEESDSGY